jgi:hypothetical protein
MKPTSFHQTPLPWIRFLAFVLGLIMCDPSFFYLATYLPTPPPCCLHFHRAHTWLLQPSIISLHCQPLAPHHLYLRSWSLLISISTTPTLLGGDTTDTNSSTTTWHRAARPSTGSATEILYNCRPPASIHLRIRLLPLNLSSRPILVVRKSFPITLQFLLEPFSCDERDNAG